MRRNGENEKEKNDAEEGERKGKEKVDELTRVYDVMGVKGRDKGFESAPVNARRGGNEKKL